jgi:Tfp pilus assembly protein PilO
MTQLKVKRKYVLLGAALVFTLMVFQGYFLAPKSELIREEIRTKYVLLQKYEAYLKGSVGTDAEIRAAVAELKEAEQKLIAEKSEFLASARLQSDITEIAQNAGLNVQTLRPMNILKTGNYIVVPIHFEGNGNIKQVSDFLKALEGHPAIVKVDKMTLNVTNMQNPKELRFKMQISGLGRA